MKTPVMRIFSRVGRVIPNAPLGHDPQTDVKLPVTPNRRVKDNVPSLDPRAAFTLIEMIGVMAVMAILAAILVPNVLKSIERAAVRVEAQNLATIGEQIKQHAFDLEIVPAASPLLHSAPPPRLGQPPAGSWPAVLANRPSSLNANELLWNARDRARLYIPGTNNRVLLISSMRNSVALPAYNQALNDFDYIWNLPPNTVPVGWAGWNVDNLEYLLIERVNYSHEIKSVPVRLNGNGGRYVLYNAAGAQIDSNQSPRDLDCKANYRVELRSSTGVSYVYVVGSVGKSFDYDGSNWTAP